MSGLGSPWSPLVSPSRVSLLEQARDYRQTRTLLLSAHHRSSVGAHFDWILGTSRGPTKTAAYCCSVGLSVSPKRETVQGLVAAVQQPRKCRVLNGCRIDCRG